MTRNREEQSSSKRPEPTDTLQKAVLAAAAVLMLMLPPVSYISVPPEKIAATAQPAPVVAPPVAPAPLPVAPALPPVVRLATFGAEPASADVRHVANWAVQSGDFKSMSFVIVDKKEARVYVFNPQGELRAVTPALLGSARGDDTVPGIGDKPLSQVLPQERTTPAGRFVAEPGVNLKGEDIVWVDYDAAVSMHRVRAKVKAERRLQRLASLTAEDNRISFGCINLPVRFYEKILSPTVKATGAIIYVLPETRAPSEVFGSYDVLTRVQLAQR